MLNLRQLASAPKSIVLMRERKPIEATCLQIGELNVHDHMIAIGEAEYVDETPSLPVPVPNGTVPVYAYQWIYKDVPVNVCLLVKFSAPRLPIASRLKVVSFDFEPSREGVMIDTGEIAIRSDNVIVSSSGLGDGIYPVFCMKNWFFIPQSLIIDFELWQRSKYALAPGQGLDEWGFPEEDYEPDEEAMAASHLAYQAERKARLEEDLAPGGRLTQGTPCPDCKQPMRTDEAKQCFLCGWEGVRDDFR